MSNFVSILLRLSQVPKLGSVRIQQILAHVNIEDLLNYDEVAFQQIGGMLCRFVVGFSQK